MSLVVDASVSVKWLVDEEASDAARNLLVSSESLEAPHLLVCETANAIWRKTQLGQVRPSRAGSLISQVAEMPIRWHGDETVCADAVRLAVAYKRPVYDFVYLALAARLGVRMVTADMRFVNALADTVHDDLVVSLKDLTGEGWAPRM